MIIQMKKMEVNGYCVTTGEVNLDIVVKKDIIKTEKCLDLLTEKGAYPYDYMNKLEKLNEEQLPKESMFTVD